MEYVILNNGMKMPLLSLGTWDLRGQQCIDSVVDAIDVGYRLIDTAQMYDNEKEIGIGIKQSGISRHELFLTTKIYGNCQSYQKTKNAIIESLNNLQTDYLDLVLLNEPILLEIGNKYHKTPQQVALRFLTQRNISVISKSKRKSRLKENIDIFDFVLSDEDINKIKQLDSHDTLFPWTKMF